MKTQTTLHAQRVRRSFLAWFMSAIICVMTTLAVSVTTFAAGGNSIQEIVELAYAIKANANTTENDWNAPSDMDTFTNESIKDYVAYEKIQPLATELANNQISSRDMPIKYRYACIASNIYKGFANSAVYTSALEKLCAAKWEAPLSTMTPVSTVNDPNSVTKAISSFTGAIAQGTVTDAFSGTFDMSGWNPNAGVAGAAMSTMGNIVNQIFFIVSNLMMWLFMAQTGFDVLYLVVEPVRPFLTKGDGGSAGLGGNASGSTGVLSKFRLPICSSSAVEAANGGTSGGGGLGGNGASAGKSKMVITYLISRAPVLILSAIYLILVTMGYWQQLIGWIAGFVIQALDWIMTLGK